MEIETGIEEYREKAEKELNFLHSNGRRCIYSPDGQWRHWEQPQGPLDTVDRICRMDHPFQAANMTVQARLDEPIPADRGEFGMPGIGNQHSIGVETQCDTPVGHVPYVPTDDKRIWIDEDGVHRRYGDVGNDEEPVTPEARYILEVLPDIIGMFLEKNRKYARAQTGHDLGAKGIIPDINRKTSALVTAVWDGVETPSDMPTELIDDLIGHLLLMRAKMREMD